MQQFIWNIFLGTRKSEAKPTRARAPRGTDGWAPWPRWAASSRAEPHCQVQRWFTASSRAVEFHGEHGNGEVSPRARTRRRGARCTIRNDPKTAVLRLESPENYEDDNGVRWRCAGVAKTRPCRRFTLREGGKRGPRGPAAHHADVGVVGEVEGRSVWPESSIDRKSTRLNSSHSGESRMPSSA